MNLHRLAFVDTETTGTRPLTDRIIEIAVIIYENGQVVETFETLVNPQIYFDPFITEITGIRPTDLTNAPIFEDIAFKLKELLTDSVLVAHNARFDYGFIKNEFKRLHIPYQSPQLCTVKLSRSLYPHHHHHSLDDIIARFDFTCSARHRALGDAEILVKFYEHINQHFSADDVRRAIRQLMGHPSIPVHIDTDILDQLPESPGVYIFYNDTHIPLYVGKSKNIKTRVLSHFHGDISSSKEMKLAQATYHIETRSTAGELSALILESRLVKELQPLHNRMLRLTRKLFVLTQTLTPQGYASVTLEPVSEINVNALDKILGIFKSKRQAQDVLSQITEAYNLCPKLLGLESDTSSSNCFAYHLGKCKGACTGIESPLFYNIRFQQAFFNTRLKHWPFPGPVQITEVDYNSDKIQSFIVNQWCILSESSQNPDMDNDSDTQILSFEYYFDLDTYKILTRFCLDPKNQNKIKILSKTK